MLKAKAAHYVNDTFCDNFYVSSQEDEIMDEQRSCGAKSQSDGSEFNLSKLSTKHCVFGQEKIAFAKKSRRSISMDYGKNYKFEKNKDHVVCAVAGIEEDIKLVTEKMKELPEKYKVHFRPHPLYGSNTIDDYRAEYCLYGESMFCLDAYRSGIKLWNCNPSKDPLRFGHINDYWAKCSLSRRLLFHKACEAL